MTGENDPPQDTAKSQTGRTAHAKAKVTTRVQHHKERVQQSAVGELAGRLKSADLINEGMTFAALTMLVFFPTAITLSAVSPLNSQGAATFVIRKMGLSGEASAAVERLFAPHGGSVLSGWTLMSLVWLVVGALALASTLQAIYLRIWGLKSPGLRGIGANALWICSLLVATAAQAGLGDLLTGNVIGDVGYSCLLAAWNFFFIWFSIRLLVVGALGWRQLLPTAVFTTIGLLGLAGFSKIFFSASIVSNDETYGSIGVVFIIMSWLIGIGVVIIGGAVMGAWYTAADVSFIRGVRRLFGHKPGPDAGSGAGEGPTGRDPETADPAGP